MVPGAKGDVVTMRFARILLALALAVAAASVVTGCGVSDEGAAAPTAGTEPFLEDLEATLVLPADTSGGVPLVTLVPGGGWFEADIEVLEALADDLAAWGCGGHGDLPHLRFRGVLPGAGPGRGVRAGLRR